MVRTENRRNLRTVDSVDDRASHLAAFNLSVVHSIRRIQLVFVKIDLEDEVVARMEIGKRDREDHSSVLDLVGVSNVGRLVDQCERNGGIDARTAFRNVKERLAFVERAVAVLVEIDRYGVERRATFLAADPCDVEAVAQVFLILFGVDHADGNRVGREIFALLKRLKAANVIHRIRDVSGAFALLASGFGGRNVFNRVFLHEERHSFSLSCANYPEYCTATIVYPGESWDRQNQFVARKRRAGRSLM